jgi:carbonic anhydrase/acetyltransferase-like protein (isoleucine patch superfamily)
MSVTVLGSSRHARDVCASFHLLNPLFVDDEQGTLDKATGSVVWGIGSPVLRHAIYERIKNNPGLEFMSCVHKWVPSTIPIGEGTVVMPGCHVSHGVKIGKHCLIHTGTILSHDVEIGDFVTVSPGCILLGNVRVGSHVQIGAGSVIRERVQVSHTIGMGSVVLRDSSGVQWGRPARSISWCWRKPNDWNMMNELLEISASLNQFTNGGPLVHQLAQKSRALLSLSTFHVVPCCSGTAALHAMVGAYRMAGTVFPPRSILASAFGFAPMIEGPMETTIRLVDMDPIHGGPQLDETPPVAILLVNPFGYVVDVEYYRAYCDQHQVLLFMDNASTPYTMMTNKQGLAIPVAEWADACIVSLHETKPLGKGEGGLLCVRPDMAAWANKVITFGFDTTQKVAHPYASNWRMSDIAAAAILMHWKLNFGTLRKFNIDQDHRVVDQLPFRRGSSAIMSALLEPRCARPNMDVRYYYEPLLPLAAAPHAWHFFQTHQVLPFHPDTLLTAEST